MKRLAFLLTCFMISMGLAIAQSTSVKGIVLDNVGEPIIGASVVIKGTSTGTATDIDGNFSLNVPENARTLVVSYLGMETKEVPISQDMKITLSESSRLLDEVVVTALGISREKKALGYAAQNVKGDDLTRAGNTNMMTSLQGKVAGVEVKPSSGMPGASSQVVIRGARSFTGNNTPLYVIDGMPVSSTSDFESGNGGSLSLKGNGVSGSDVSNRAVDIDPNEIESINVLRGQAAAALYGIRASNGVIVITTKSGKGLAKGKPRVSLSVNSSMEKISRQSDFQQVYAQGSAGAYSPNTSMSWGPKVEDLPNDPNYGGNVKNKYNDYNTSNTQGKYYVPQLASAGLDPWVTPQKYDNIDDYFKTGYTINTSVNVSQATENTNYSIGLGNATQEGIIPSTSSNRTSAKAAAETNFSKAWKTGFSANYIANSIDKAPGANDGILGTVYPAPISYNLKGIPTHYEGDPYKQISYRSLTFDNPYWAADNNLFTEKTNRFFGNGYVQFTPQIDWSSDKKLWFKYQLGVDYYTSHFQDIFEYGHRGSTGLIDNYGMSSETYNSLLTAGYDMNFTEDLQFSALLGNEFDQRNTKGYSENGQIFNFGGWAHIDNATVQKTSESQAKERTVGFFGSLSLTYRNMLYLSATGRNDYVSTMPSGNRSFFYPSISLGFVFTEIESLQNDILSFGKLRASYAEVGQAGTYYNNYYSIPSYGGGFWSGEPIIYPNNGVTSFIPNNILYDKNLKPQNTRSYEIGAELRFLNNLFGFDYTFSKQNVKDQIFGVPLAGSTGASELVMNGGRLHTDTHELTVTINPIRTKDWNWTISANFTKMVNEVDELAPGVESIMIGGFVTPQVRVGIGNTFPVIYGTQYARDDQGRILVDEDPTSDYYGMPMAGSPGVIGVVSPDFLLGGSTVLNYKKFTLSATIDWKNGGDMYSGTNGLGYTYGTSKLTEDRSTPFIYKGYKADGTPNDIQRGGSNDPDAYQLFYSDILGNIDEAYIFEASFVKLREISLSYQLPRLRNFDIGVSAFARNILLWTTLPNIDPESSQGNTNMGGSFERFSMPQASSFGMGVNVTF